MKDLPAITGFQLKGKETIKMGLGGSTPGEYEFKIQPDVLILSGSKDEVARAVALLDQVDVRPPQVLIEQWRSVFTKSGLKDRRFTIQVPSNHPHAGTLPEGILRLEL